MLYTTYSILR